MKSFIHCSSIPALACLAAAFGSSSCSLPPREAWNQIQRDGLIAFLSNECCAPASTAAANPARSPAGVAISSGKTAIACNSPLFVGPPGPAASLATTKVPATKSGKIATPAPAPASPSGDIMPAPDKAQLATSVPSLPGFVRSPYTTPPRLVDVKGAAAGATMICPYTQRAFIIPSDFVNLPAAAVLSDTAPATTKPMAQPPAIALKNNPPSTPPPATNPPTTAQKQSTPGTAPPPGTKPPASALFTNKPATNTAPAKPAAPEIPYGMPIPNRPGFVNSPFAAKHQLVDVTGLPVGIEVKCPYTGKLFRVPALDIAEQKAVASPAAPPAPEKAEKPEKPVKK